MTSGISRSEFMTSGGGCWDVGMEHRLGTEEDAVDVAEEDFLT